MESKYKVNIKTALTALTPIAVLVGARYGITDADVTKTIDAICIIAMACAPTILNIFNKS